VPGELLTMEISTAAETVDILGEAPMWHVEQQKLYWVDAFRPAIRHLDYATGEIETFMMPADIGSSVFKRDGRLICGCANQQPSSCVIELPSDGPRWTWTTRVCFPEGPRNVTSGRKQTVCGQRFGRH
jgi:hypothetical protein